MGAIRNILISFAALGSSFARADLGIPPPRNIPVPPPKTSDPHLETVFHIPPSLDGKRVIYSGTLSPDFPNQRCSVLVLGGRSGFYSGVQVFYQKGDRLFSQTGFVSPSADIANRREKVTDFHNDGESFVISSESQSIQVSARNGYGYRTVSTSYANGKRKAFCHIDPQTAREFKSDDENKIVDLSSLSQFADYVAKPSPLNNNLMACGSGKIKYADLSWQFPPTHKQTDNTCGDFQTSALKAALMMRNYRVRADYSPEYLSCVGALYEKTDIDRNKQFRDGESYFDGSKARIRLETALKTPLPGRSSFLPTKKKINEAEDKLQHQDPLTGTILWLTGRSQSIEDFTRQALKEVNPAQFPSQKNLQNEVKIVGREVTSKYISQLYATPPPQAPKASRLGWIPNDRTGIDLKRQVQNTLFAMEKYSSLENLQEKYCDDPGTQETIREMMKYLCVGVPLVLSTKMNKGSHSVILQGVEMRYDWKTREQVPYFVLRNSWKEGTRGNRNASLSYLPFSRACIIQSYYAYLGPRDPDPKNCGVQEGVFACNRPKQPSTAPQGSH